MSLIKKENICIVVDTDNNGKNYYKTIGELVTMQGQDGPYQFIKLWGAGGVVNAKVFEADSANNSYQQAQGAQQPQQNYQQPPQQGYQQQPQQGYQQPRRR